MLHEIDLFGVYVSPFVIHMIAAAIPFFALRWLLARLGVLTRLGHTGLIELSLYVVVLSLVVYS